MNERMYCTPGEVAADLGIDWTEAQLLERCEAASQFIERRLGRFLPMTETRHFDGQGTPSVQVVDLLAVTSIAYNGVTWTTSQYNLYPANRCWTHGPYSRVEAYLSSIAAYPQVLEIAGRWGLYEETTALGVSVTSQTDTSTSLTIPDTGLLYPGAALLIGSEMEQITGGGGNTGGNRTYTVRRAACGTTAAAHASAAVSRYVIPEDVNWLARQIAGLMRMKAKGNFAGKSGNAELGEVFYLNEFPSQIKDIRRNYRVVSL